MRMLQLIRTVHLQSSPDMIQELPFAARTESLLLLPWPHRGEPHRFLGPFGCPLVACRCHRREIQGLGLVPQARGQTEFPVWN